MIVQDGLDVIGKGIENVRESVAFWTATPKRIEKFEAAAKQERVSITKKLSLDCKTRWNSTFLMLEGALRYKQVFSRLKQREKIYKSLPSYEVWKATSCICEKLKVFYDVTELFSGTNYVTANLYFLEICKIRLALDKWQNSDFEVIHSMALKMKLKFEKYWEDIHGIMGVAAILDPRYKKDILEFYLEKIYGLDADDQLKKLMKVCEDLVYDYSKKMSKESSTEAGGSNSISSVDMVDYNVFVQSKRRRTTHVKSELNHYLEDNVLPWTESFDILAWWKTNGLKYPTLQAIARDIYAIPVSTVAFESSFSMGGRIISPHRSRLLPTTVEALACCQNWLIDELSDSAGRASSMTQTSSDIESEDDDSRDKEDDD